MGRLAEDLYWVACVIAGEWRSGYLPHGINLLAVERKFPLVSKAVYIACDRDGRPIYVGKVTRSSGTAVRDRTGEHVQDAAKAQLWVRLYIVPLRRDTPDDVVLHLEGEIGRRLLAPKTHRLPRPRLLPA